MKHIWYKLFLLILMSSLSLLALDVRKLKDSHDILKDEFKHCSPVHGAVWWEDGLLKSLYSFGNESDNTVKLIRSLFITVSGSFNVTQNSSYPAKHFSAKTIGKIIGTIEKERAATGGEGALKISLLKVIREDSDFKEAMLNVEKKQAELNEKLKEKSALAASLKPFLQIVLKARQMKLPEADITIEKIKSYLNRIKETDEFRTKASAIGAILSTLAKMKEDEINETYKKYLSFSADYLKQLEKEIADNDVKKANERLNILIDVVIGSLKECGGRELRPDQRYFPYATHAILLGFLYRKAQSKEDLKQYFDSFAAAVEKPIFTENGMKKITDERWLAEAYKKEEFSEISRKIEDVVTKTEALRDKDAYKKTQKILADIPYTDMVVNEIIQKFYSSSMPKFIDYGYVTFEGKSFADCVETTVRNICNIVLFDRENGVFNVTKASRLKESVKKFYEAHNDPFNTDIQVLHQLWSDLVSNLPYVTYKCITSVDGSKKAERPITAQGFVYLPGEGKEEEKGGSVVEVSFNDGTKNSFKQIDIAGKKFIIIDPAVYHAYEIRSSLKNVIIILNDILGLDLYPDLRAEFKKPNFNVSYFAPLCAKLNWVCDDEYDPELDTNDFNFPGLSPVINSGDGAGKQSFRIEVGGDHTELVSLEEPQAIPEYKSLLFSWLNGALKPAEGDHKAPDEKSVSEALKIDDSAMKTANLCVLYLPATSINDSSFFASYLARNLVAGVNLFISNIQIELISTIFNNNISTFYYLAANLMNALPIERDIVLATSVIELLSERNLEDKYIFDAAKKIFQKIQKNGLPASYELLTGLVNKGLAIDEAVVAAKNASKSKFREEVRLFNLWIALISQNAALDAALTFAEESSISVGVQIFSVWEALFKKDGAIKKKTIEHAINVATVAMKSDRWALRDLGLKLWILLFKEKQGTLEARKILPELLRSEDKELHADGEKLAKALEALEKPIRASTQKKK